MLLSSNGKEIGRIPEEQRREEIIRRAEFLSAQYKRMGFHCSESTIRACSEALDLHLSDDVIRAACGFRGGGGGSGDRCGILEAGTMLISLLYGRSTPFQPVYRYSYLIRSLYKRFELKLGSIYCRDILGKEKENHPVAPCIPTYVKGCRLIMEVILDADEILRNMPEEEMKI